MFACLKSCSPKKIHRFNIYRMFSLCYSRNFFCLWWWREWGRTVWCFHSSLFQRSLFDIGCLTSGRRRRQGHSVRGLRDCGGGRRGLELGRSWESRFGELNCHLLVVFVQGEGSFCCKRKQRQTEYKESTLERSDQEKGCDAMLWCRVIINTYIICVTERKCLNFFSNKQEWLIMHYCPLAFLSNSENVNVLITLLWHCFS